MKYGWKERKEIKMTLVLWYKAGVVVLLPVAMYIAARKAKNDFYKGGEDGKN